MWLIGVEYYRENSASTPLLGRHGSTSMSGYTIIPGLRCFSSAAGRLHIYLLGDNMKPWAEHFYKSKAWRDCRDAFFIYKHGICERCGGHGEIVHHKEYLTPTNINDPNITLNWDNLELLCQDCHNKEHSKELPISEGLMFDEEGNLYKVDNNMS